LNLGQLLLKTLPIQLEGKVTSGAAGTIVDSALPGTLDDDAFKGALAFISQSTDGLAPESEFAVVSAFAEGTGTFTLDANFTAVAAAGDFYAVADPQFAKVPTLRVINDALRNFGIISLVDVSLTAANNTLEYTLPLAIKSFPIDRIEIGNAVDGYAEITNYEVTPALPGTQAKLIFQSQPSYDSANPGNGTLRIWYRDYHPKLDSYDDKVSETIPDKRVIDECKLALYEYLVEKNSDLSEDALRKLNMLQNKQANSEVKQRINVPNRRISKFLNIRDW
jgi:hypothetical protein